MDGEVNNRKIEENNLRKKKNLSTKLLLYSETSLQERNIARGNYKAVPTQRKISK